MREFIRRVFLLKAIGRKTGWTPSGIAKVWDELFWRDREVTRTSMDASVKGILSAHSLYKKLPKEGFEVHSARELRSFITSGVEIYSSGDFLLEYPDRFENWIFFRKSHKDARRSVIPAAEHFLIQQCVRTQKPFFVTFYYVSTSRMNPSHFRIRDDGTLFENSRIVSHLAAQAEKKISFPIGGPHCKDCKVNC